MPRCDEGFHLVDDLGGLVFQGLALLVIVGLGILARLELEVEVAQVFVDGVLALAEVVDAGLVGLHKGVALRPENVGEAGEGENEMASDPSVLRLAANAFAQGRLLWIGFPGAARLPSRSRGAARRSARRFQSQTIPKVPTVASMKMTTGTIQAILSKPPRMGAAKMVAPYFASNHCNTSVSLLPLSICAVQLGNHTRRIDAADMVAFQQDLPASAGAHEFVAEAVEARPARAQHDEGDHA